VSRGVFAGQRRLRRIGAGQRDPLKCLPGCVRQLQPEMVGQGRCVWACTPVRAQVRAGDLSGLLAEGPRRVEFHGARVAVSYPG